MSTPLSVSENTALGSKLTPSQAQDPSRDDNPKYASAPPSSPPRPRSITTSGLGTGKKLIVLSGDRFSNPSKRDHSPLLSERDSIFATHYLPSDSNNDTGNTSRFTPVRDGRSNAATSEDDLNVTMESPISGLPPFSQQSLFSAKTNSSSTITPPTSPLELETSESNNVGGHQLLKDDNSGFLRAVQGIRRAVSEVKRFPAAVPGRTQSNILPNKRSITIALSPHSRSADQASVNSPNQGPFRQDSAMDVKEEQKTTGPGRSASRGRHVEKRIEATVPNDEPPKDVRSRKSSHYLKLFNANKGSAEAKTADERRRDRPATDNEASKYEKTQGSPSRPKRYSISIGGVPYEALPLKPSPSRGTSTESFRTKGAGHKETDVLTDIQQNIQTGWQSSEHLVEEPVDVRDTLVISDIQKLRELPREILEEIRDHNLTPGPGRGTSFSRSIPVTVAERSLLGKQETIAPEDKSTPDQRDAERPTGQEDFKESEEDEEHNKEHISSAVYFPHAGLSPEEVEHFKPIAKTISNDSRVSEEVLSPRSPVSELCVNEEDYVGDDHVDISLQSKGEKLHLHGDLEKPKAPRSDVSERSLAIISEPGPSSASESEPESSDEATRSVYDEDSGLTDDGEVTPTATPVPGSRLQKRRRESVTTSTLSLSGSVQLKPYKDQVGGHSQVFGFSHQAVCKQLNNRENEFYERIERRHPEMLKFLPR
jgi:inositol-hexakisphosphate kinase